MDNKILADKMRLQKADKGSIKVSPRAWAQLADIIESSIPLGFIDEQIKISDEMIEKMLEEENFEMLAHYETLKGFYLDLVELWGAS